MLNCLNISLEDDLDWDKLIKESSTATFFQNKEWLQLWVKHWGKNLKVVIYAVYDNDELIGIAPFGISDKINILGAPDSATGNSFNDFGDIIAKTSCEEVVWKEVLANIKDQISKIKNTNQKSKIELNFIREESPSYQILQDLGGKAEEMEVAPCINLPKTWEEYLSTLDRHDRHEIRRKMRKIEDDNVLKACDEINTQSINEFYRLMSVSNEEKSDFLTSDVRAFLGEVIIQLGSRKLLTLCFLKHGSEKIAAILLLYQKNEVLLYNSGFDPNYSYLSPGLILNVYAIKQAIEEGRERFDFLRGGEKYKYDLGGKERKLYKIKFD